MTQGEKAVILWLASLSGISLLSLGGILWFPTLWREETSLMATWSQLGNHRAQEAETQSFFKDVQERIERLKAAMHERDEQLRQAAFIPLSDTDIPAFLQELKTIFSPPGLHLLNLAYQPRTVEAGFVTLPFEVLYESQYEAWRRLLQTLESHPGRPRIDRLEFQQFDNEHHMLQIKMNCSVRFASNVE